MHHTGSICRLIRVDCSIVLRCNSSILRACATFMTSAIVTLSRQVVGAKVSLAGRGSNEIDTTNVLGFNALYRFNFVV
jgi:hypothetical protein